MGICDSCQPSWEKERHLFHLEILLHKMISCEDVVLFSYLSLIFCKLLFQWIFCCSSTETLPFSAVGEMYFIYNFSHYIKTRASVGFIINSPISSHRNCNYCETQFCIFVHLPKLVEQTFKLRKISYTWKRKVTTGYY